MILLIDMFVTFISVNVSVSVYSTLIYTRRTVDECVVIPYLKGKKIMSILACLPK